ncbi:MAG TPA: MarR family transcriptional regulator [Candidatus Saccharimonadales bacterium]|nr:MarR family transcriptional regulator [Candidatus Saccharimonadales bacterium]
MQNTEQTLLPVLIKRCARIIDRRIDAMLKKHGIARSQYRVMYYVAHGGEPSQKELQEKLGVQASTMTLIVNTLVQKGWLVRVRNPKDKRHNKLQLSAEGKKLYNEIPEPANILDNALREELGKDEARLYETLLIKTINRFNQ